MAVARRSPPHAHTARATRRRRSIGTPRHDSPPRAAPTSSSFASCTRRKRRAFSSSWTGARRWRSTTRSFPGSRSHAAVLAAAEAIARSATVARAELGHADAAGGHTRVLSPGAVAPRFVIDRVRRSTYDARPSSLAHTLAELLNRRAELPQGSFVFISRDFLDEVPDALWSRLRRARWDVVPVIVQDPTWKQSFPEIAGVLDPLRRGGRRRASTRPPQAGDVTQLRHENEQRLVDLTRRFRRLDFDPVLLVDRRRVRDLHGVSALVRAAPASAPETMKAAVAAAVVLGLTPTSIGFGDLVTATVRGGRVPTSPPSPFADITGSTYQLQCLDPACVPGPEVAESSGCSTGRSGSSPARRRQRSSSRSVRSAARPPSARRLIASARPCFARCSSPGRRSCCSSRSCSLRPSCAGSCRKGATRELRSQRALDFVRDSLRRDGADRRRALDLLGRALER